MYLFVGVLALVTTVLLLEPTPRARIVIFAANLLLDLAAVATVGRSRRALILVGALAVPAIAFQIVAIRSGDASPPLAGLGFAAALYAITLAYVLRYVFLRDVMTGDKLYGAAAGFMMLGVLWAILYTLVDRLQPGGFGMAKPLAFPDFLYSSLTILASTGFGDIIPVSRVARTLVVLEELIGTLFLAILIARLTGVYPPRRYPAPADDR
jgi:hypothetical protein